MGEYLLFNIAVHISSGFIQFAVPRVQYIKMQKQRAGGGTYCIMEACCGRLGRRILMSDHLSGTDYDALYFDNLNETKRYCNL